MISIGSEKAFEKAQHSFVIKALKKPAVEGTHFGITKAIHDKPAANIMLSGEQLKTVSAKSQTRQEHPPSPLTFNIVFETLEQ